MNNARPKYPVNYGTTRPFPSTPTPGGFNVTNNVQLISERIVEPRQWVITLSPITKQAFVGVLPWFTPFDGQNALPVGNQPIMATNAFRARIAWGAGGVRNDTIFDWPYAGGTFGLVADTLDLWAQHDNDTTVYANLGDIPVFGAFMAPGVPAGPSTMVYSDVPSYAMAINDVARWAVKPFARSVRLSQLQTGGAAALYRVSFEDGSGTALWETWTAYDATRQDGGGQPLPVPAGATLMEVESLAAVVGGAIYRPMWTIELS